MTLIRDPDPPTLTARPRVGLAWGMAPTSSRLALVLAAALSGAVLVSSCASPVPPDEARTSSSSTSGEPAARKAVSLRVTTRASGLNHPWDVKAIPGKRLLVTERDPARLTLLTAKGKRAVRFPTGRVYVEGETGLMGLEVDPGFSRNHRIYTCSGWKTAGGGHDVRVNAWRLDKRARRATLLKPLVTGLPSTSGRHGGCRLLVADDGSLLVGTGDAAVGTNPRDLTSLGGKTLRLNRFSGKPWPRNPFRKAANRNKRYLFTYGHRNVQGLAQRRDGSLWSVEHGSYRDDEVNRLRAGGDYGWNPVPGYDESVPMTDQSLPGRQVPARWRSGDPTVATSGSTFVYGRRWGALNGALAVAVLKGEEMLFLTFDGRGRLTRERTPAALKRFGRLRTATQLADGSLLIATDADNGAGRILRVVPRR